MTLEDLQRQKSLLEQKKIDLDKISLNQKHSQMNLRGGRRTQLQRQQDQGFGDIVRSQKTDTSKKISSITELIAQQEYPDSIFTSLSQNSQIQDFSILPKPTKKTIRRRGRIQQNMGWFME